MLTRFFTWLHGSDDAAPDREGVPDEAAVVRLIVGLGNPEPQHASTRHNAGFWFVDELADRHGGRFAADRKFQGEHCRLSVGKHDVRLLKPMTYMNRSGASVRAMAGYLKVPPEQILVVHDEIDLPPGTARLKRGGGHGGHNGLRDVISHIGADYARLRLGVGHPGHRDEVVDYVLRRPSKDDSEAIRAAIADSADVIPLLLGSGYERAMHRLHTPARKSASGGQD